MRTVLIPGSVGVLEVAIDLPTSAVTALALVAHPHPLNGGTMDNKVVTTIARACTGMGYATIRFNYRGVGQSQGVYDAGVGEVDDAACALAYLCAQHPELSKPKLVLAGFSFGTAVAYKLARRLGSAEGQTGVTLAGLVLAGAAVSRFSEIDETGLHQQTNEPLLTLDNTLMIHGECDETVPLAEPFLWAKLQGLAVTVVPDADHFFNKKLIPLKHLVTRHLSTLTV